MIATCSHCGGDLYFGPYGAKARREPVYAGLPDPERWRHSTGRILCPTSTDENVQYADPVQVAPSLPQR